MEGWIKLHRVLVNHWIFNDAEKFKAWICILIEVNHQDKKVLLGDTILVCKRGESVMSLDSWAKLFGNNWNKSKVRRFFGLLETDKMIVTKSERVSTRLTVCNYDSYQEDGNANETQTKRKRNANEAQVTPNKNDKNDKNKEIVYTYNEFYDNELKNSNEDKNYKIFIGWLFGDNYLKRPLKNVLSMREQMNFKQFESFHTQYKLIMQDASIVKKPKVFELLIELEDWVVLERKHKLRTLAGMLRTFMNRNVTKKY